MALLFAELAAASESVAASSKRNTKVGALAVVLARLAPDETAAGVAFLTGRTPLGRIGVGWAALADVSVEPATEPSLTVGDVARAMEELAVMAGAGVAAARRARLAQLLGASTQREQRLLRGIFGGELRQGALEGVMTAAVAQAHGVPLASVRHAAMMAGDLGAAAVAAATGGRAALDAVTLLPLRPVLAMLASPAADIDEALGTTGAAVVEAKLDGARVQAHRRGSDIALFTRNLNDVTDRLPGVVDAIRSLPGRDLVLDGEVLGLLDDGSPRRFQDTMGDFGSDGIAGRGRALRAYFFDLLFVDDAPVHDEPLVVRRDLLAATVPENWRPPSIVTAEVTEARTFLDRVVRAGHEGVMVKDLDASYDAGRRGAAWRKVKPVLTLDLVVLAVEWGHGRRTGWLSNLHLGARSDDGGFVMVGKTFKGLTDELLTWQTARFQELAIGTEGHVVHVRPEQVVEVALDGVQVSTRYPGGVALRFARVRRYRNDKTSAGADTIEAVQELVARPPAGS